MILPTVSGSTTVPLLPQLAYNILATTYKYRLLQKECHLFEFASFPLPTNIGKLNELALTELPSAHQTWIPFFCSTLYYSGPGRWCARGLVKFVPALASLIWLVLPGSFLTRSCKKFACSIHETWGPPFSRS